MRVLYYGDTPVACITAFVIQESVWFNHLFQHTMLIDNSMHFDDNLYIQRIETV